MTIKKILILIIIFFTSGLLSGLVFNYLWHSYLPVNDYLIITEVSEEEIYDEITWQEEILAQGFQSISTIDIDNRNNLFLIDNNDKIFIIQPGGISSELVISWRDKPIKFGEAGLLGLALHPQFDFSPFIYIFYTYEIDGLVYNRLSRFIFKDLKLDNEEILIDRWPVGSIRNAGYLTFDSEGRLLLSIGDMNDQFAAQDKLSIAGKILRYDLVGQPALDNPISGNPILALGLRQPNKIIFNKGQGFFIEEGLFGRGIYILIDNQNYNWPMLSICQDTNSQDYLDNYCDLNITSFAFCNNCSLNIDNIILMSNGSDELKLISLENNEDQLYTLIQDNIILENYRRPRVKLSDNQGYFYLTALDETGQEVVIKLNLKGNI